MKMLKAMQHTLKNNNAIDIAQEHPSSKYTVNNMNFSSTLWLKQSYNLSDQYTFSNDDPSNTIKLKGNLAIENIENYENNNKTLITEPSSENNIYSLSASETSMDENFFVRESKSSGSTLTENLRSFVKHSTTFSSDFDEHIVKPLALPLISVDQKKSSTFNDTLAWGTYEVTEDTSYNYINTTSEFPWNLTELDNLTSTSDFDGLGNELLGKNYWALLLVIFPIVTIFGNILVILSVKRERSLWTVTNYFIVSLAVADLLVAALVMPFAVYFLFNNQSWHLAPIFCDLYIAMDVTCSTSSILNLVAISIDRYIAVTKPIKYAKHKNNTRVWLTILFVWVFSGLVGSPIVLGLNNPENRDERDCSFHNKYFVLASSLCSFYIPCAILVCLYYRIFKVIRERAKKATSGKRIGGNTKGTTVIENLAQTNRLAETTLGGPSSLSVPRSHRIEEEKVTGNTGSGSQDGEDDDCGKDGDEEEDDDEEVEDEENVIEGGESSKFDECKIIANSQVASAFVLESVSAHNLNPGARCSVTNGNHDSGYAPSNMDDGAHPTLHEPPPLSPKISLLSPDQCKKNGLNQSERSGEKIGQGVTDAGSSQTTHKKGTSRFTICKAHKASRKKREKSSAKRERKATKTLAIVLGLFLACWLPFFTCNMMDALCTMFNKSCSPGMTAFILTTWFGYVNSCVNPVVNFRML